MNKSTILLFGEGGSGKSTSIVTLFKLLPKFPDLKIRWLGTENNALLGIYSGIKLYNIKLKPGQLSYMICKPDKVKQQSSRDIANNFKNNFMNLSTAGALKVKVGTAERVNKTRFYNIITAFGDFKGIDYVTEKEENFGDYLKWDNNVIFIIDSLTSIVDHLVDVVQGPRISYGIDIYKDVQNNLMNMVILPLIENSNCSVIMLGHPIFADDNTVKQPQGLENIGDRIQKLYPKTFGQKINNLLISKFTETIYAYNTNNDEFFFAGKKSGVATSPRKFPRKDKLPQDFSLWNIFEK